MRRCRVAIAYVMSTNEEHRHRCEVRDWVRRIRERPTTEQVEYWRKWREVIAAARGKDAAARLHRDVVEMLRER